VLLGQVPLVLGLQIAPPEHRILERLATAFENLDRVGVADPGEIRVAHGLEASNQALVDEAVQEFELRAGLLEHRREHGLDHLLLQVHVLLQGRERDLRLDHPELGRVARRVAVLGAEGRAERVDVPERERETLAVELSGHGQAHGLCEEVLVEIDRAVGEPRRVGGVERRHAEHLARALAVAAGQYRRVHVDEAAVVEEAVDRLRSDRAHAERALEQVRARAQVLYRAQVLERVALLLQRVVARALAEDGHMFRLQFKRLLHAGRRNERPDGLDRRADGDLPRQLPVVGNRIFLQNDLEIFEMASVVELDEREALRLAHRAHPAADLDLRDRRRGG